MSQSNRQSEEALCYEFGPFRVDTGNRLLLRGDEVVPLTSKVFDILLVFVQNSGRLLDKDEVMREVWPESFVEEGNLTRNVSTLRKALGESPHEHQYIVTVPGRGYRFVARVSESESNGDMLVVEERIRARIVAEEEFEALDETAQPSLQRSASLVQSGGLAARATNHALAIPDAGAEVALSTTRTGYLTGRLAQHRLPIALGATALVIAASVVAYFYVVRGKLTAEGGAINALAIMPFSFASTDPDVLADPDREYLSDGITESLINNLSQLPEMKVIASSSIFRYKGKEIDPQAVGRELGVQAILTGRIVQRGDVLTINVELVDSRDNSRIWGKQYERKMSDLLVLQRDLSKQIAENLRPRLTGEELRNLNTLHTENAEAYQLLMKGFYYLNKRTKEGGEKAVGYFQQAIDKDQNFAPAYSGLAGCYAQMGNFGSLPPAEAHSKASEAVTSALKIDNTLAAAHATLAWLKFTHEWDWSGSEQEYRLAIELNPNLAGGHRGYATYLSAMGRHQEAIRESKQALTLDPLSITFNSDLGETLYTARRYDQAIEQLRQTIDMDPNFPWAHRNLGLAYEQKKMYTEALTEFKKHIELSQGQAGSMALGHAYAVAGMRDEALQVIARLQKISQSNYIAPFRFAMIYTGLGENDQAFEWLEKSFQEHSPDLIYLKVDPRFDNLRSDPRFTELLRRMNLAP